jgi:hypothetical protein
VDNDIDPAESVERGLEKLLDLGCIGNIRLVAIAFPPAALIAATTSSALVALPA